MNSTPEEFPYFETSAEALAYIYRQYGEEILLGSKLTAYLADYAPELSENVIKLIKSIYTSGISDLLKKAAKGTDDDRLEAVKKSQIKLKEAFIDEKTAVKIISEFTCALGWENVVTMDSDTPSSSVSKEQPKPSPEPTNRPKPRHSENYTVSSTQKSSQTAVNELSDPNDPYIDYVNEGLKYLYPEKTGTNPNYDKAFKLFRKAAENGSCWGRYYMGFCCANGYGVKDCTQNWEKAIGWYLLSAQDHNIPAVCALGDAYYYGRVTAQNINEAKDYYEIAALENDPHGQYGLGMCYLKGDPVEQKEGVKWLRLAADQDYADAEYQLGCCLRDGTGTKKDNTEAAERFYQASLQNNYDAQYEFALCCMNGTGTEKNEAMALKYFLSAAKHRNTDAAYYAGLMYINGTGTEISPTEAFRLFKQAADMGHTDAQFELGKLYYNGTGTSQNVTEAKRLFSLCEAKGKNDAAYYLGHILYMEKDYKAASKKFRKAADVGSIADAEQQFKNAKAHATGAELLKGISQLFKKK